MKDYLVERALNVARHIDQTHDTIRGTAEKFNYSKTTIHLDVSKRLKKIDHALYLRIQPILEQNFSEKHIRGGQATKKRYEQEQQ